jgi:hypothetical protein
MEGKDIRELLDLHSSLGLLKTRAFIAKVLVLVAKCLAGRELAQAGSNRGVHFNIDR